MPQDGQQSESKVKLVFSDIAVAAHRLQEPELPPSDMRVLVERFISKTQQLTSIMRTEFKARTDCEWSARAFAGWNNYTELFKRLRNLDQHQAPIMLAVNVQHHFDLGAGLLIAVAGRFDLDIAASFSPPPTDAITLLVPGREAIRPVRTEYYYSLNTQDHKISGLVSSLKDDNLSTLTAGCFRVLEAYYEFYCHSLEARQRESGLK